MLQTARQDPIYIKQTLPLNILFIFPIMATRVYNCTLSTSTILWQSAFLLIYSCAVILIPPRKKAYRRLSVVALTYITYLTQTSLLETCLNPHWRAIGTPLLWIQLLSASELITVSSVSPSTFLETCQASKLSTVVAIFQGILLLWNLRRIGTPWAAKNVPSRSQQNSVQFVAGRFLRLSLAYVLLDLSVSAPGPSQHLLQVPKHTLWRLWGLSLEDAAFRTVGSISFWITVALLLYFLHGTASTAGVILNLWQTGNCAPLFGSFREAYSLRKFWGVVWHQCLRQSLCGFADAFTHSLLRIPPGTLLSRYARLTLAFALSGAVHYAADLAMGIPPEEAGGHKFFMLQALLIMFEDLMQYLMDQLNLINIPRACVKLVGFTWVLCALAWSTPTWFYPMQRLEIEPSALMPFRVAIWIKGWTWV
ncbi:TRI7-trichothecene biosynthesis [Pyrenophora seminiperda CCB06]|uniref:TRI7-trichothecene biosynthesis n=1 Tax=Pyrenophora seminiperda CCB06 TaxID=1302712 RepID=A0A3M7M3W4_9PLEO|nr:TRI7-trichothecene biosynthesis [Pyrenophora seminiperda CCB06]